MAFVLKSNVVLNNQVVSIVKDNHLGVGLVNGVTSHKGLGHILGTVEEDAIPARNLRLSALEELHIADLDLKTIEVSASSHHVWTVIANWSATVSQDLNVSCEQTHLCPYHQFV